MALEERELVQTSASDIFANFEQVSMHDRIIPVFGTSAGAEELATCAPVGYNDTTDKYGAWVAPDPTVLVVTLTSATAGTFTVTVDGITTGTIAYNATAADVKAAILAIGVSTSVDLAAAVYTITFDADTQVANVPTVTGDVGSITGGSPTAVATAGTSTFGLNIVRGFVFPDPIQLSATLETQGTVMVQGRIDYSYIEPTVDVGDVDALKAELKRTPLGRGIIVEGLVNIH
jgi:hypothetical protein